MQIATIAQRSATISVDTGNEMSDYPNQNVGQNSVRNSPIMINFMLKFNKLNGGFEVTLMMFHSSCGLAPGRPKLMIKNAKSIISTAKSSIFVCSERLLLRSQYASELNHVQGLGFTFFQVR